MRPEPQPKELQLALSKAQTRLSEGLDNAKIEVAGFTATGNSFDVWVTLEGKPKKFTCLNFAGMQTIVTHVLEYYEDIWDVDTLTMWGEWGENKPYKPPMNRG